LLLHPSLAVQKKTTKTIKNQSNVHITTMEELVLNRNNYQDRGWCRAEISWSSVRSRTSQNLCIDDAEATVATNELQGEIESARLLIGKEVSSEYSK